MPAANSWRHRGNWGKERGYQTADLMGFVEERLAGVRDIQTGGAVTYTLRGRFYELVRRRTWQAFKADVVTDIGWTISKIFYDMGTVASMALGAYLFLNGQLTLGTVYLVMGSLSATEWPADADCQPVGRIATGQAGD